MRRDERQEGLAMRTRDERCDSRERREEGREGLRQEGRDIRGTRVAGQEMRDKR
jgi:hypothetical protein